MADGRGLGRRRWAGNEPMSRAIAAHPRFRASLIADTRFVSARRGRSLWDAPSWKVALEAVRIAWESDAYLAQISWRLRNRLVQIGVPILPTLLHHLSVIWADMSIDESVVARPGIAIPHGQVVIGGLIEIGTEVTISPFVSIGLVSGSYQGPTIGRGVAIGTGARILGPVSVGARARIGANAVVLSDVPPGATAVGSPARSVAAEPGDRAEASLGAADESA